MIEVKIPAEIQEYKSKLIAGLSTRQVISIAGALAVTVPLGVFGRHYIPADILPWLVILSVVPFAGFGFLKVKDMLFEDFMRAWLNMTFLPQVRAYEVTQSNLFHSLHEELLSIDLIQQRIENGEYDIEQEWRK